MHGSTFYTNRNSAYGVARRRQDNFVKAPYVNRNEYGVSLGGPVIILYILSIGLAWIVGKKKQKGIESI